MNSKHCVACNQEFPSGALTCPYCGAGPVIVSEAQWHTTLSRLALLAKRAMYGVTASLALTVAIDPDMIGWLGLLLPAYWSHQYFQDRVAGHTARLSAGLNVRQDDPLNTRGFYDAFVGFVAISAVTTAVVLALTRVFG